jgi:hypothetical protein
MSLSDSIGDPPVFTVVGEPDVDGMQQFRQGYIKVRVQTSASRPELPGSIRGKGC